MSNGVSSSTSTAQLIDTRTGYHLWSETYDRELKDVFAIQDEISRAIVRQLQVKLTGSRASGALARQETVDPEAHALVLKGSYVLQQATRETTAQAAAFAEEAIRRDPSTRARTGCWRRPSRRRTPRSTRCATTRGWMGSCAGSASRRRGRADRTAAASRLPEIPCPAVETAAPRQ